MTITVYIPSYNQKAFLAEAIESVLGQTRLPDEIIIIDDASSDGSRELIRSYAERHPGLVRAVLRERNAGIAHVRNEALRMATGEWITYVDGDDRWLPRKLELEAAAAGINGASLVFSNHAVISAKGDRTGVWVREVRPPEGDAFVDLFARNTPGRGVFRCELARVDLLRSAGGFDTQFDIFEDIDLRLRACRRCKVAYVDEVLSEYRVHGAGLSAARAMHKVEVLRRIYRKNRALLAGLPQAEVRRGRRGYMSWVGIFAHEAAMAAMLDLSQSSLRRRGAALRMLLFCAVHSPDRVTLGDLYRAALPARWAGILCDG